MSTDTHNRKADVSESSTTEGVATHKLRVHALFRMPELVGLVPGLAGTTVDTGIARVDRRPAVQLRAVYHDTEDLRLIRWGVTLCRRAGGVDEGWHLTMQAEGSAASADGEMVLPLDAGEPGQVPHEMLDVVTALARRNPLLAVATLHTQRTSQILHDHDDKPVAELVDDVVSIMDGDVVAGRFRELQISSLGTEPGTLEPVIDLLLAHGAMPGTASNAASALGPAAKAGPDVPEPSAVSPDDPSGDAVHAHLLTHVHRFLLQDMRVRRDLPDSVHQMRVAARRLRSGLRVFSPLVDPDWSRHLRDELGWAASELGLSRDSEVLLARLDAHADELGDADAATIHAHVDPLMQAKVDAGRAEALEAMRSERHIALLDALVAAAADPQLTQAAAAPAREALPPLFDKAWRKLAREVKALTLDGPSEEWHETRITAKRARYAAEALVPVFGPPAKGLATSLSNVTEQLGEHQDASIAQETCRELAAHFDGPTGFSLGLLHAYEVECELIARVRMKEQWPAVRGQRKQTHLG
ncbi:MAG TPA: CYTH and CHAD domain-containing protein [Dermatophilaceae bacterium]|nr:CYTH and CHAD domain-containing protein [Dermatophilaceae bacterium]